MLVGPAGGGKTTTYNILSKAITIMDIKINQHIINPKSIDMGELYG